MRTQHYLLRSKCLETSWNTLFSPTDLQVGTEDFIHATLSCIYFIRSADVLKNMKGTILLRQDPHESLRGSKLFEPGSLRNYTA